ncbi:MAG TPA: TonB-dependent receptor [Bacteroidales bacterium]
MKAEFYNYLKLDTFAKKFLILTGILLISLSTVLTAQQTFKYEGLVTDKSGAPLPGVNVIEKGTTNGTTTDIDGKFQMSASSETITLDFSMVGFSQLEYEFKAGDKISVQMLEDVVGLDEVLVVGYGTQKRANVTSAIASMDSEQLTEVPVTNVNNALQGRLSGVTVTNNSGSPGSSSSVVIRGVGTNATTTPLYVVDGIRMSNIDNLNPYDVESLEVLKDAASAAIYGADAGNGVVLITTKKGKKGESVIDFNMQIGSQSIGSYTQPMDGSSYATWVNEANVGVDIKADSSVNTDWMDAIQTNAMVQQYSLSFSGGTDKGSYYTSLSYVSQDGTVGGDKSNYQRITALANITQQVKPWLKVGVGMNYVNWKRAAISEDSEFGGIIASALMLDPTCPIVFDGALPSFAQSALNSGFTLVQNGDGQYYGVSNYVKGEITNPLMQMDITQGNTKEDRFMGNGYLTFGKESWKGFYFTSRVGVDLANQLYHTWYPTYWASSERMNTQANVRDNTNTWTMWLWENFLTYDKTFGGKHHVNAILGYSAQENQSKYLTTLSGPMFAEGDTYAQHGDVVIAGDLSGTVEKITLSSWYARASYDYEGKYLLTAIFRRDGSSLLGSDMRYGNFPSVSAGWIISKESFWNVDAIDFLKIRGSWGQNGMLSGLDPDQFRSLITTSGIKYPKVGGGFYTGGEPQLLANPELKWATSAQTDIGLDMYMLANRLYFGFDWYKKVTQDLLTLGTPPPSVGNYPSFVNAGDVTNTGTEFEVGWRNYERKFKYSINVNATWMTNEVTYLNPLLDRVAGSQVGTGWTATWLELNQPIWFFRGYKTDGIFQNEQQIIDYKNANGGLSGYNPVPGDPIVVNTNGDNLINDEDQTFIGDPNPSFMWGAMFNLEYSGFDFRFFIQGVHGQDVLLGWNRYDRSTSNRPQFFFDERWTGEGSTNEMPRADQSSAYIYNSDLMVYSGSYVRIRQMQLGYTLPAATMSKMQIQNLRFYISLDNFFTFTNYPGMDPEAGSNNANSQGIDRGYYSTPRTFLFGVNFTF